MGRPGLEPGTYGKVRFYVLPDGRVQARALFRDFDGKTRPVTKVAATQTAAERDLKRVLRDRQRATGDALIRSDMRVDKLADIWIQRIDASDRAIGTKQQYRKLLNAYVRPAVGNLRIQECQVSIVDRALTDIADLHGPSVGKSCRAVLAGMLGLAARHDAIPTNPVRDTEPIRGAGVPKKGKPRALTIDETTDLTDRLRTIERAVYLDLPDLVDFMLATGCRIGEALACRYGTNRETGKPLLDLDAGTWEVNATTIRVAGDCTSCTHSIKKHPRKAACASKGCVCDHYQRPDGAGLIVQERTKTEAGWRILALPPYAVDMLRARYDRLEVHAPGGIVFGSPHRRSLRDPSNTAGDLKEVLALLGPEYQWVTFHTFRKTVATRMKDAGCSDIEVADQLGHKDPSMTRNVYMGRQVTSARAAEILDR